MPNTGRPVAEDLTGRVFGRLTVARYVGDSKWLCRCECGNTTTPTGYGLRSGRVRSCKCLQRELSVERGSDRAKHGMRGTPIYTVWVNMRDRCGNPNRSDYKHWGGRGIRVCDAWQTFEGFYADMGGSYQPGLTIDRIETDGHYTPGNCRWVTVKVQSRNRRNNTLLERNGVRRCVAEWAEVLGVYYPRFYGWVKRYGADEAFLRAEQERSSSDPVPQ